MAKTTLRFIFYIGMFYMSIILLTRYIEMYLMGIYVSNGIDNVQIFFGIVGLLLSFWYLYKQINS